MVEGPATDLFALGEQKLTSGDWSGAREAFESVLAENSSPQAEEGLGRTLWWEQDAEAAIPHIERAYTGYREAGDAKRASRTALWLSREYSALYGNASAAGGWYARAEGLLRDAPHSVEHGWLALSRAERASAPREVGTHASEALAIARRFGDADLEAASLARLGYAEVAQGDAEGGMVKIDEAMTAATGGEVRGLETIGDVVCVAIAACEQAADWQRIEEWGKVVEGWVREHNHVPVLGFCYACCAEMFVASGQWEMAEGLLTEGLGVLQAAKQRSRCVHPAAKLAELRLMQGRIEDAEQLLAGFEELPEATHAMASLYLARGEVALAAAVLYRRLNALGGDNVLAAPFLALLVEVQLAQGSVVDASATADRLGAVGEVSGLARIVAAASLARGRVATARGDDDAVRHLERALASFSSQGLALDGARARIELARAVDGAQPEVAVGEARIALAEFERLGAPRDADAAAAFLRERGASGRTGPKQLGLLSRRELEVLQLLAGGLTNAEIAARLYISTKTAGNHVSNILAKLNVRSRTEAAAYATRYLARGSGQV